MHTQKDQDTQGLDAQNAELMHALSQSQGVAEARTRSLKELTVAEQDTA